MIAREKACIVEYYTITSVFYSLRSKMLQIDFENEILQRIKKAKLNRSLNKAVRKSIFTIERQAKIETPVDT